jgi:hypothetical protein
MKRILGIILALSFSVATSAHADDTVGRWQIQGDKGTCSASTSLSGGQLLMIFSKPPGDENGGGLMFGDPAHWKVADGPVEIELVGQGSVTGKHTGRGYADLSGYWLPFGSSTEMERYPDSWQLKAIKDGQVLIDQPVTEFKAAVAALEACAAKPA